jgi:hypothetical protein
MDTEWKVFKLKESDGKTAPFVSIGRGTLDFSQAACALINDNGRYRYAQILTRIENGKTVAAVSFLEDYAEDCIPVKRKVIKGKQVAGMTVRNKNAIERLFGKDGVNEGMVRHKVEPIGENMLKIID